MKDLNKQELELISKIARRAVRLFAPKLRQLDTCMDIEYTHHDIPLDLDKLMQFDDFNFIHDIGGIYKHFNRETLKMEDCFLPRCAL